jgi:hypothetical protein
MGLNALTIRPDWRTRRNVSKLRRLPRNLRNTYISELMLATDVERTEIVKRLMAEPIREKPEF